MKHVFGPVASRRLGRSLGVDVLPFKTCTLDCVFCECGDTTMCTVQRAEVVSADEIIADVRAWVAGGGTADFITIAGSGEPTLNSRFGDIIRAIKSFTKIPICLLTNGTLLHLPEVRRDAALADVVVPSLNAADAATFARVCRPCTECTFEQHIEGLKAFSAEYHGALWLEVFIVPGINDSEECVRRIATLAASLSPLRIQLNTAVRPPAVKSVHAASYEQLAACAELFTPKAEIVASYHGRALQEVKGSAEAVLTLLRRRPCTEKDIADGLGISGENAAHWVVHLRDRGMIAGEQRGGDDYYAAVRGV